MGIEVNSLWKEYPKLVQFSAMNHSPKSSALVEQLRGINRTGPFFLLLLLLLVHSLSFLSCFSVFLPFDCFFLQIFIFFFFHQFYLSLLGVVIDMNDYSLQCYPFDRFVHHTDDAEVTRKVKKKKQIETQNILLYFILKKNQNSTSVLVQNWLFFNSFSSTCLFFLGIRF